MQDPAVTAGIMILASLILVLPGLSSLVENKKCCPIYLILLCTCQLILGIRKNLYTLFYERELIPFVSFYFDFSSNRTDYILPPAWTIIYHYSQNHRITRIFCIMK